MCARLHTVICGPKFVVICYRILQHPVKHFVQTSRPKSCSYTDFEVDLCMFLIQLNSLWEHYPATVMNLSLYIIHKLCTSACLCRLTISPVLSCVAGILKVKHQCHHPLCRWHVYKMWHNLPPGCVMSSS